MSVSVSHDFTRGCNTYEKKVLCSERAHILDARSIFFGKSIDPHPSSVSQKLILCIWNTFYIVFQNFIVELLTKIPTSKFQQLFGLKFMRSLCYSVFPFHLYLFKRLKTIERNRTPVVPEFIVIGCTYGICCPQREANVAVLGWMSEKWIKLGATWIYCIRFDKGVAKERWVRACE